ncbi:transaldolase/EF-hand domain-containing protein [Gimesia alba]|uniref:Transaldolase/EF-hand domain-containing protein n=1 Tax=Gimesia alba TaxID=2527973 RepID=A0A517RP61_9PLAN|nr:EF-hand domain-containing protein [Gimesia alba]QDT45670.1 transaldolase/EF-hand domain-containing protein [Gimesia alba]
MNLQHYLGIAVRLFAVAGIYFSDSGLCSAQTESPLIALKPGQPIYESLFLRVDKNEDGRVSLKEYQGAAKNNELIQRSAQFKRHYENNDGGLTRNEFKYAPLARPTKALRFEWKDQNRDQKLSLSEILRGESDRWSALVRRISVLYDANQDGSLSFSEWEKSPDCIRELGNLLMKPRDLDGDDRISLQEILDGVDPQFVKGLTAHVGIFDLNHDRFLGRDEFPVNTNLFDGTTMLWGGNPQVIFNRLDHDENHSLDGKEFKEYEFPEYVNKNENTLARFHMFQANAEKIFRRFDQDQNHQLSLDEFSPPVDLLFARLDHDQNARLSLNEYRIWISKKVPLQQVEYDFNLYDQDHDQFLSLDEFKVTPLFYPSDKVFFGFLDLDNSKTLSLLEFQRQKPETSSADLKWNFHHYDADNDDELSLQEYRDRGVGVELDSITLFKQKDSDGNGKLTQKEFILRIKSKQEIDWALKTFSVADENKDELLTPAEFKLSPIGRPDVLSKLQYYDLDKNGNLSFKEWVATKAYPNPDLYQSMFALYDTNQNAQLEIEEFKYTPLGGPSSEMRFEWKDVNKDGRLTQEEVLRGEYFRLSAFMRHVHARFDSNKDALLSYSEWENSPAHLLRFRDLLLGVRDLDGDDQISLKDCLGTHTGNNAALITKYFGAFDVNQDKFLQRSEFPIITDLFNGTSLLFREDYQAVFSNLDIDQNGSISRKEFKGRQLTTGQQKQAWAINRKKAFLKYADQTFDRLDSNKDQQLSLDEFTPSQELLFSRVDVDQDRRLSISELALILSGLDSRDLEYDFNLHDQNKDAALSQTEFSRFSYFYPDRSKLFSLFDRDQNSKLSLSEFQAQKPTAHAADLKRTFHQYDANNDDHLNRDEFKNQGVGLERDSITVFNEKDTNGDKKLSADEFLFGKRDQEIEGATKNFKQADTDQDQYLTAVEFKLTPAGRPDALSKLEYLDTNGDGSLSLVEFNSNHKYRQLMFMGFIFDRFDQNQDGQLSLEEFRKTPVAQPIGLLGIPDKNRDRKLNLSDFTSNNSGKRLKLAKFYFSQFDVNQDGWLRHDEFPVPVDPTIPKYSILYDSEMAFLRLDTDGDQLLSLEEFRNRQTPNDPWSKTEYEDWLKSADDLFAKRDLNHDNKLSVKEFSSETPLANWIIADGEILHSIPEIMFHEWSFFSMDRNKDHQLSEEEYLRNKPQKIIEKVKEQFQQVDFDKNKSLTFEEYKYHPSTLYIPWEDFWWRDKNHDHFLDAEEFSVRYYRTYPILGQRTLEAFDTNKDGKLSYTEFRKTPDANPIGLSISRVRDNNNDGKVELKEFAGMLDGGAKLLAEEHFAVYDRDKNGELSWAEFSYRLDNTSFPTPAIFAYYDKNQDQLLTYSEMYPDEKKQTGTPGTYALTNQKRFQTLDRNRDGFVNWDEYKTSNPGTRMKKTKQGPRNVAVTFTGGTPAAWLRPEDRPVPPSAISVFKNKDKDHDSQLSFAEYLGRHYSPQSEAAAKTIFAHFNRDSDEFLTFDEFKACPLANPDAETLFTSRDRNQDQKVDLKEFIAYRTGAGPQNYLGEIFKRFDANGDATLDLDEFKATPDAKPTSDIVLPTRDMNGDGKLDISEFSDVPTDKPSQTLQTQFEWLDLNHDGFLTLAELKLNDPIVPTPPPAVANLNSNPSWLVSKNMMIILGVCLAIGLLYLVYKAGKMSAAR